MLFKKKKLAISRETELFVKDQVEFLVDEFGLPERNQFDYEKVLRKEGLETKEQLKEFIYHMVEYLYGAKFLTAFELEINEIKLINNSVSQELEGFVQVYYSEDVFRGLQIQFAKDYIPIIINEVAILLTAFHLQDSSIQLPKPRTIKECKWGHFFYASYVGFGLLFIRNNSAKIIDQIQDVGGRTMFSFYNYNFVLASDVLIYFLSIWRSIYVGPCILDEQISNFFSKKEIKSFRTNMKYIEKSDILLFERSPEGKLYNHALNLFENYSFESSLDCLKQIESMPSSFEFVRILNLEGLNYLGLKKTDEAILSFLRVIDLDMYNKDYIAQLRLIFSQLVCSDDMIKGDLIEKIEFAIKMYRVSGEKREEIDCLIRIIKFIIRQKKSGKHNFELSTCIDSKSVSVQVYLSYLEG